jgi:hypothetical protein
VSPEEALARASIRVTQNAYHTRAERGRGDEAAALFTEDGVLEFTEETHRGRHSIADALNGVGRTSREAAAPESSSPANATQFFLRHHLTTSHVEFVSDSEANGWSYFLVISPIGLDHAGRYIDTYERRGDDWLIASRRVSLDWTAENSVVRQ